ncbi:MAG: hypothetical protein OIF40_15030, partial [Mangrovicoccus sp.]|nr:hypothetical protein [Mangrovicoccus sp.]
MAALEPDPDPAAVPAPDGPERPDTDFEGPSFAGPSIDLARIEADGSALVGGRGRPGAEIELLVDGRVLWQGAAGPDGSFAALFDLPASPIARMLWLRSS